MNNIIMIDMFLQKWQDTAIEYYLKIKKERKVISNTVFEITRENLDKVKDFQGKKKYSDATIEKILGDKNDKCVFFEGTNLHKRNVINSINSSAIKEFESKHSKIALPISFRTEAEIKEFVKKEAEIKKKKLISSVLDITGRIIDCNLCIGKDGNLNGVVHGQLGKATVQTIYAGGYNIQCLHYRVLVKKI